MGDIPTGVLREGLLGVHGIGEETADSILCYGFSRPSFVIDAYTERMVRCAGVHGTPQPAESVCSSPCSRRTTRPAARPMHISWNTPKSSVERRGAMHVCS